MSLLTVGVLLKANAQSLLGALAKSDSASKKLQSTLGKSKGARKAANDAAKYRRELTSLKQQAKQAGGVNSEFSERTKKTARALRKARREARGFGFAMRAVGRDVQATESALRQLNKRTPQTLLGKGVAGARQRVGGLLPSLLTAGTIRSVLQSKIREETALFRLGTVSGLPAGGRSQYLLKQLSGANQITAQTGLRRSDILSSQYAILSAGLPKRISQQAAVLTGKIAKVTGGSAESVSEQLGIAFNNFGDELEGTNFSKLTQIGDLFTQTQLQYQIRNFDQLGEGFKYASVAAKTFNIPLQDTVGFLGQLNSLGLQGGQAGTAFAAMVRQLGKDKTLKAFNFELVKTADGQLDLIKTLEGLSSGYSELIEDIGQDAASNKFAELFGDEGMRAAALLIGSLDSTDAGLKTLFSTMAGATESNFSEWSKTVEADVNRLSDSFDNLKSAVFLETGLLKPTADFFNSLSTVLRETNTIADETYRLMIGITSLFSDRAANSMADSMFDISTDKSSKVVADSGGLDSLVTQANRKLYARQLISTRNQTVNLGGITVNSPSTDPLAVARAVGAEVSTAVNAGFDSTATFADSNLAIVGGN